MAGGRKTRDAKLSAAVVQVRVDLERDRRSIASHRRRRRSRPLCRGGIRRLSGPGRSRPGSRTRCRRPPCPPVRVGNVGPTRHDEVEAARPERGRLGGMGWGTPGSVTAGVAGPERRKALGEPRVLRFNTPQWPAESVGPGSPLSPLCALVALRPLRPGGAVAPFGPGVPCSLSWSRTAFESFFLYSFPFSMSSFEIDLSLMSAPVTDPFLMSCPVISLAAVADVAPATRATIRHAMIVRRTTASSTHLHPVPRSPTQRPAAAIGSRLRAISQTSSCVPAQSESGRRDTVFGVFSLLLA